MVADCHEFMTGTNATAASPVKKRRTVAARILGFLCVAWLAGWSLHHFAAQIYEPGRPAGFARGLLHGALMPLAMPNLIAGQDATIYSPLNTGRPYKLGYTVGVNGCGLLFFGFFFWRLRRLRQEWRAA